MSQTARFQETLRRLAIIDETFVEDAAGTCLDPARLLTLDPRTALLLQLGALVATGASPECLQWSTGRAMAAGVADDEIADVLLAVAPVAGIGRVFSAAPEVAIALGYDVTAALEELDDHYPAGTESARQAHDGRESLNQVVNSLFRVSLTLHAAAADVPGDAARGFISEALQRLDQAICEIRRHAIVAPRPELSCRVRPGSGSNAAR
jgi:4-carboxymuconolactone decarboxylase